MKVALLGGTNTWKLAPFDDPEWKKWVLGNQISWHLEHKENLDKIFEIHNDLTNRGDGYPESLAGLNVPMIVGAEFPLQGDHIEVFPFETARKLLGGDFLTSTPAYMMALCCLMRLDMHPGGQVTDIALYGIDMSIDDTEYFYEQPVMKEWIGFAKGIGISIHLPKGCPLGRPNYIEGATANSNEGIAPFRVCDFQELIDLHSQKMSEIEAQIAELQKKLQAHGGAKQAYERMRQVARARWGGQE
jgi:hypothetical protein